MKGGKLIVGTIAGALAFAGSADARIRFDPTGSGSFTEQLTAFDWLPGNTIATGADPGAVDDLSTVGGVTAVQNFATNRFFVDNGLPSPNLPTEFYNYYQAGLGTYTLADFQGAQQMPVVGNQRAELTIVAGFRDRVVDLQGQQGQVGSRATFEYVPTVDQVGEFIEIYYDTSAATSATSGAQAAANTLAGTGFNDGQLILRADITFVETTTFTQLIPVPGQPQQATLLDQSDTLNPGNQYGNKRTVAGNGSTLVRAEITEVDTDFFELDPLRPQILDFLIVNDLGVDVPFTTTDPNSGFATMPNALGIGFAGPAPNLAIGPDNNPLFDTVGAINGGGGASGGPDIVFQTDANMAFFEIPEPLSASLGLMGLGALSLAARRRQIS